mgnify:FL=1
MPLRYRPATRQDITHFYPDLKHTFRAWVVENEDKVLGIGGVYYDGDFIIVFSRFEPELEKYPLAKARGVKKIMEIVGDRTCLAIADEKFPESAKLLERIGFKHIEGRVYKWTTQRM